MHRQSTTIHRQRSDPTLFFPRNDKEKVNDISSLISWAKHQNPPIRNTAGLRQKSIGAGVTKVRRGVAGLERTGYGICYFDVGGRKLACVSCWYLVLVIRSRKVVAGFLTVFSRKNVE